MSNGQKQQQQQQEQRPKNRPVFERKLGAVRGTVWANVVDVGNASRVMYNTTITRLYKDGDGNWQDSQSFGPDDLLLVAKVANECHTWTVDQQARDREAERQQGDGDRGTDEANPGTEDDGRQQQQPPQSAERRPARQPQQNGSRRDR